MNSIWVKSFKESGEHSYHRRAMNQDYYAPFIYHIIFKKQLGCEIFGTVVGDARIAPGNPGCADIDESVLGKTIAKEIIHLPYEYPIIKMHQFKVMPDHVHMLLQVLFRSDKHLDFYMDFLRMRIASKYSKKLGRIIEDTDIFEIGYCDKPLYDKRSLDGLYTYIEQNPHRLAMRLQYPQFFTHLRNLPIGGKEYAAYGNLFLFRNPDKEAAHDFALCEQGRLLIISLGLPIGTELTYPICSEMNKLAKVIAGDEPPLSPCDKPLPD